LRVARHQINVLDTFGLVERVASLDDGELLYAATLDTHPEWVREAVDQHRA